MSTPPGFAKPTEPPDPEPKAEWEVELEQDPRVLEVRDWRMRQLAAAGFSDFTAFRIAIRFDVDYRQAVGMLNGGATELQVTDLLID